MLTINLCKKTKKYAALYQMCVQHNFPEKKQFKNAANILHNNVILFLQGLTGPPGLQGPVGPPGDPGERVSQQTDYPGYLWYVLN